MPSIADQVATLEHDLADALAKVDALNAANEALARQNTAVIAENNTLQDKQIDMQRLVDDTRIAADRLATAAAELLRASRRTLQGEVLHPARPEEETAKVLMQGAGLLPIEAPETTSGDQGDNGDVTDKARFAPDDARLHDALIADGEKLRAMTGMEHGPMFVTHTEDEDALPIFLNKPGELTRPANVLA